MTPSVDRASASSNPEHFPDAHLKIEGRNGFKVPPLDGSLNFIEIMQWHAQNNADFVWAKYRKEGTNEVVQYNYSQMSAMVQRITRYLVKHFDGIDLDAGRYLPIGKGVHDRDSRPVVAMVANMDTLSYFCVVNAVYRAGLVPFCISINNSREAIAHLLKSSSAIAVLRGSRGTTVDLDTALDAALADLGDSSAPRVIEWPESSLLFNPSQEQLDKYGKPIHTLPAVQSREQTLFILHSSGSTGFPKAIPSSHKNSVGSLCLLWHGDVNVSGRDQFVGHLPAWHAFAFFTGTVCSAGMGTTNVLREPTDPPKPVSPQELLAELAFWKPSLFPAVPVMFHGWAPIPAAVKILANIEYCINGGGPIDPDVAHTLKRQGVKIKNAMAATETMLSVMINNDEDPLRMELPDRFLPVYLRPQGDQEGQGEAAKAGEGDVFEILIGENDWYAPNVLNETVDGKRYYATKDLIRLVPKEKPTDRTYFHVVGRLDDQIMHATGEKTNPGPLLHHIQASPFVRSALYFGRQRNHVGALIEPTPGHEIDPSDLEALAAYRNAIWPAVEKANSFAPSHSLLFKEMIIVADMARPLPRTAKGSVRSGIALELYKKEIDQAYEEFETIGRTSVTTPEVWDQQTVETFVRSVIGDALGRNVDKGLGSDADIFSFGVNSLNATKIRNVFAGAVRDATPRLEPAFVYANPTIQALTTALLAAKKGEYTPGGAAADADLGKQHLEAMQAMLEKYGKDWPQHRASKSNGAANGHSDGSHAVPGQVALVTGTTGGLGAHLLDQLVADAHVSRIFAVNRSNSRSSLLQRQRDALIGRGLSPDIASNGKVTLVEADLTQPLLGLPQETYASLRDTTTFIIHNAWQLNFNLSLSSFEPHIKGTRALIDLALASPHAQPPAILFTSSIAAIASPPADMKGPTPETEFPLECSVGPTGYGESKAVTEHLLARAAREAGLPVANVRVGQMSGSRTNGAWATSDWLPMIVRSASELKCLPLMSASEKEESQGFVSWIPTDVAAEALLEMRYQFVQHPGANGNGHSNGVTNAGTPKVSTMHIVNPRLSRWGDIFGVFAHELNVELLPFTEWLNRLMEYGKAAGTSGAENLPTLKLLDFYLGAAKSMEIAAQAMRGPNGDENDDDAYEAMGLRRLSTSRACAASSTLAESKPLDAEKEVKAWLGYWKGEGFLPKTA